MNLDKTIRAIIEDYGKDFEVGNIDSAVAYRSWKSNLVKDILKEFSQALIKCQEETRKEIIENIDVWLEAHSNQNKSFESKDLIKYLKGGE